MLPTLLAQRVWRSSLTNSKVIAFADSEWGSWFDPHPQCLPIFHHLFLGGRRQSWVRKPDSPYEGSEHPGNCMRISILDLVVRNSVVGGGVQNQIFSDPITFMCVVGFLYTVVCNQWPTISQFASQSCAIPPAAQYLEDTRIKCDTPSLAAIPYRACLAGQ